MVNVGATGLKLSFTLGSVLRNLKKLLELVAVVIILLLRKIVRDLRDLSEQTRTILNI